MWGETPFQDSGNWSGQGNLSSANTYIASVRGGRSWTKPCDCFPVLLGFWRGNVHCVPLLSPCSQFSSTDSPSVFVLCPSSIEMILFSLMERIFYTQEIWARTPCPCEAVNTWLRNTIVLWFVQSVDGTTLCLCPIYRQYYRGICYLTSRFFYQTCLNK